MYNTTDKALMYTIMGLLIAWSIWGITNFPYRAVEVRHMVCYGDDGVGPYTKDCGDMEVRCYADEEAKERVECPFYENIK